MYELVHSPTFICTIFCEYPLGELSVNQQKNITTWESFFSKFTAPGIGESGRTGTCDRYLPVGNLEVQFQQRNNSEAGPALFYANSKSIEFFTTFSILPFLYYRFYTIFSIQSFLNYLFYSIFSTQSFLYYLFYTIYFVHLFPESFLKQCHFPKNVF